MLGNTKHFLVFLACCKVNPGPHFIEGLFGVTFGGSFNPGPHFIETNAWIVTGSNTWLQNVQKDQTCWQDLASKKRNQLNTIEGSVGGFRA